jgi:hypothetical protein
MGLLRLMVAAMFFVLIFVGNRYDYAAAPTSSEAATGMSIEELRRDAADRKRRVIFNNDGNEPISFMTRPSKQDFLDCRSSSLVGAHVDSFFYCTTRGSFGLFSHFTKVGHVFTSKEGLYANNQMAALVEAGIDPLQVMVDFCKKNKIEIFWSLRMNDTHDGSRTDYGPIKLRANPLKTEHPEYLLGTANRRPKHGAWTAVDYGRPEIRDLAFRFVEEVCQNYDVDGVELDFFRHPVFFPSTSRGEPATDEERAAMTDLLNRVRAMADEIGKQRGRPILIAARTPDSVEYCRAIGLDIEKWMADDLVDLYIPAGYFQLNDWNYSVALARKYGVKIYPSLDDSRIRDEAANKMRSTILAYRGRAANVWAAGADGVYIFNHFDPHSAVWRELGEPDELAKFDKDYFASVRGSVNSAGGNLPFEPFQHIETLNPKNPKFIGPGESAEAQLNLGEDFAKIDPITLRLRFRFDSPLEPALLRAIVNEQPVKLTATEGYWLQCSPAPTALHSGANRIRLSLLTEAKEAASWLDLVLEVRH